MVFGRRFSSLHIVGSSFWLRPLDFKLQAWEFSLLALSFRLGHLGFRLRALGTQLQNLGFGLQERALECWTSSFGIKPSCFRPQDSGLCLQALDFKLHASAFGNGLKALGLGQRDLGFVSWDFKHGLLGFRLKPSSFWL
ncbi:hypothetical protein AXF42_Ash011593 [Apostasia shenzhenica]|uniref:Uncharacterized protein n=1 Tax=Apostasia shenzhenica TaxID=1088818 RepID=A0A2I0BB45_9ASPA|nr:hypothetical protein AXF42_Ash011593 [Apostasia shenzhenica]